MLHANPVAQVNTVFFARPPAICMIRAAREKCRKNAMLHVKHGHMVMQREFKPFGRSQADQGENLIDIEVMRNAQALKPAVSKDTCCGWVGDVQ